MKLINYHSLAIVVAALVVALVVTMVVMPLVRRLAIRLGAIDMPGKAGTDSERHLHTQPTPRMGGLAIFLGFCISMARFVQLNSQLTTMLAGALIIAVLGMVDDVKNLPAWLKLIFSGCGRQRHLLRVPSGGGSGLFGYDGGCHLQRLGGQLYRLFAL